MAQADVQAVVSPLASPTAPSIGLRASPPPTVEASLQSTQITRSSSLSSHSSASSRSNSADKNDADNQQDGLGIACHPDLAQAPGASFSVATKPQDREVERLASQNDSHSERQPPAYQLDQNGRVPANDFNYQQRDRLVSDAHQSAINSGHDYWVRLMQLSYLASQHHLSPYSVMKFGPRGSPFAYIPITLQHPQLVDETMQRQRQHELQASQWLLNKQRRTPPALPDSTEDLPLLKLPLDVLHSNNSNQTRTDLGTGSKRPASVTTPPGDRERSHSRTTTQSRAAIETDPTAVSSSSKDVRPPISRMSSSDNSSTPSSNDVDPSHFDRSTQIMELANSDDSSPATPQRSSHPISKASDGNPVVSTDNVSGSTVEVAGPLTTDNIITQELEDARPVEQPAHPPGVTAPDSTQDAASMTSRDQQQFATKTSDTHPIHISPVLPESLIKDISQRLLHANPTQDLLPSSSSAARGQQLQKSRDPDCTHSYMDMEDHARAQVEGKRLIGLRYPLNLASITSTDPGSSYMSQSQLAEQAAREVVTSPLSEETSSTASAAALLIGNMLLSSCPGKKVRLSGPVRGRGAICRDLGLDLKRIFGIGVRAIVCCLDDDELSYLGAPWPEYEKEADALGLDVIRLPMAEGFAPTDVRQMDTVITSIVTDYTMKGTDVLVHCRGGVGRAGLIACSWMLKMGFVGTPNRIEPTHKPPIDNGYSEEYSTVGQETARGQHLGKDLTTIMTKDTESEQILDTVSALIETIRRRRSPKAIETAEQVRFLVELVAYLKRQDQLRASTAASVSHN